MISLTMKKVILGSSSENRRKLLPFACFESPNIDEKAIRCDDPYTLPLEIAKAKAKALFREEDAILITSDQIVLFDGSVREKPDGIQQAREFIESYSHQTATIINAIVVTDMKTGHQVHNVDTAQVTFGKVSADMVTDKTFTSAGGITEHLGYTVVGDTETVLGLSTRVLKELLLKMNSNEQHI